MKILHTTEFYFPSVGGVQDAVLQISEQLVRLGHEVTVATSQDAKRSSKVKNGVKIVEFAISGNLVRGFKGEVEKYRQFLLKSRFDVMTNFAAQQWATDVVLSILGKIAAKKVFVPTGFSALFSPDFSDYFSAMTGWLREYDVNVFLSSYCQDAEFARGHGIRNYLVIPNGAAAEEFQRTSAANIRERLGVNEGDLFILHVGSHSGFKGHEEAMAIFRRAKVRSVALVIVGDAVLGGCQDRCRQTVRLFNTFFRRKGEAKKIILAELSRKDTLSAFKEADLFLFPSRGEVSPVVLFECLAAKTPFLTTDVGNCREIVVRTGAGLLLPTIWGVNGLATAKVSGSARILEEIARDRKRRREMGKMGFAVWQKDFTWEKIARHYEGVYQGLLAGRRFQAKKRRPSVDVIIPVYNGEAFIGEAIASVLRQSFLPQRIILVNDGSTDQTEKVVLGFRGRSVPIKYIGKENGGLSSSRNVGIHFSTAEFLAFLDADDVWEKNKLQKQLQIFAQSKLPNLGVVYSDYSNIDESGRTLPAFPSFRLDKKVKGDIFPLLLSGNKVAGSGSAVLVRRECFAKVGLFDKHLPTCEDWDMWLRVAKDYSFDYVEAKLVRLRRHAANLQKDKRAMFLGEVRVISKLLGGDDTVTPTALKAFRYRLLRQVVAEFPRLDAARFLDASLSPEGKRVLFGDKIYLARCLVNIVIDNLHGFLKRRR